MSTIRCSMPTWRATDEAASSSGLSPGHLAVSATHVRKPLLEAFAASREESTPPLRRMAISEYWSRRRAKQASRPTSTRSAHDSRPLLACEGWYSSFQYRDSIELLPAASLTKQAGIT